MNVVPPVIQPPTSADVREAAEAYHLELSDEEVEMYVDIMADSLENWERLDELTPRSRRLTPTERQPGPRPGPEEDPHNAVLTVCRVDGAPNGQLAGYDVGLKDNIALAGVEMTCGSSIFDGYVPATDATVTSRLLDAGATITAKLNMESMATSGTGDQSATGPVLNPNDTDYLAGGSSSGSAVAVVTGAVDISIGTDQAGSIRNPAATNGCVGLKPTFGLVPYTGIVEIAPTIDHAGPLARTVRDCALALSAIAGEDPADPRQQGLETDDYIGDIEAGGPFTLGLLEEGFGWGASDPDVEAVVREAVSSFAEVGHELTDSSVPWHRDGMIIRNAITTEAHAALTRAEGVGYHRLKPYDSQFREAFGQARRVHARDFPFNYKRRLLLGHYLSERYLGRYHTKAQNLRHELTEAYDGALEEVDVLAMPTLPQTAQPLERELTPREYYDRRTGAIRNTSPFNVTGHPAISVPCGTVDGLPVGLMLVGRRFDDATVLQVANAFEAQVGGAGTE